MVKSDLQKLFQININLMVELFLNLYILRTYEILKFKYHLSLFNRIFSEYRQQKRRKIII
jgi:hypothetical protein